MAENITIIELSKYDRIVLEARFKNLISILFIQFFYYNFAKYKNIYLLNLF